jgi:ribose transport system ATP-binding protein
MSRPVLEMKNISKRFSGVVALDSVSLEVFPAEVVGLVGENGAGKSTLMKVLGGIYQPDAGSIRIDGRQVIIDSVQDAIRLGIAFIHQELSVLDNLDVASNIFLGREPITGGLLRLIDRKRIYSQTEQYLKQLGLGIRSDALVSSLSIAQRQMVEIAKALSLSARIIIMDEPTSSLTLAETARLLQVVKALKVQGVSIIYISHRLGEIEQVADRVVVLRDGKRVGSLTREELSRDLLVKMMVGRELGDFYVHRRLTERSVCLEVRGLRTARYPQRSVSFDVSKGEILCLAGLVGAGRTEVARAIFGVDKRLGGELLLEGEPVEIDSPSCAIAHGIYLIPEDRHRSGLILEMTIRENVTLPVLNQYAIAGLIKLDLERRCASKACTALKIKVTSVEAKVADLSGGNQQKVVLAKWLSLNPRLLIFDEPTRGIDVGAKAEIYQLMRKLAEKGVAMIVISSDMEEVLGLSDRVAVMHEGAITGIVERKDFSEELIMRLAVGETSVAILCQPNP